MRFEDKIRCLGLLFRFNVTSWIRCNDTGFRDRDELTSQHRLGLAVDVVLGDGMDAPGFVGRALELGLEAMVHGDHIHVEEPRC
jgi:hypothetical protein